MAFVIQDAQSEDIFAHTLDAERFEVETLTFRMCVCARVFPRGLGSAESVPCLSRSDPGVLINHFEFLGLVSTLHRRRIGQGLKMVRLLQPAVHLHSFIICNCTSDFHKSVVVIIATRVLNATRSIASARANKKTTSLSTIARLKLPHQAKNSKTTAETCQHFPACTTTKSVCVCAPLSQWDSPQKDYCPYFF